jgi:16S rRNA (guanine527-N7)-methyltransferase
MNGAALKDEASRVGLELSRAQLEAFVYFEEALYQANRVMNLTSVPKEECWFRHFLDSLLIAPLIPKGATVLDVGSGPGLPGVCLAIARADLVVSCVDSSSKSCDFLRTNFAPSGRLPFLLEVIEGRAEEVAHVPDYRERYDFVTGRAVAPLPIQLEITSPFCRVGGLVVPMRTPQDRQAARGKYDVLGIRLIQLETKELAPIRAPRLFPVYRKQGRTDPTYPRSWTKIKRSPLGGPASDA